MLKTSQQLSLIFTDQAVTIPSKVAFTNRPTFNGQTPLDTANVNSLSLYQQSGSGAISRSYQDKMRSVVDVSDFGAVGNNPLVDDYPGIAAAIALVTAAGGGTVRFDGRKTYYVSQTIVIDPIVCTLDGGGCILDFKNMALTDPSTVPELSPDVNFNNSAAWLAGTLQSRGVEFQIGNGQATRSPSVKTYADFGALVSGIQANQSYTFTVTATVATDLYVTIHTGVGGPGGNGVGYGSLAGYSITTPGTYTFTLTAPPDTPITGGWLNFQSSQACTMTSCSVKLLPNNYMFWVKASASQYRHGRNEISGFLLQNSATRSVPLQDGFLFQTPNSAYSSRACIKDIEFVSGGVNRLFVFADRAYLIKFFNINGGAYGPAIQFIGGSQDAGENISFYGSTLNSSNSTCVQNVGADFRFFGCSFDYSKQFIVQTSGTVYCYGCHFEGDWLGAATTRYPFDVTHGSLVIDGGWILIGGSNFTGTGVTHNYMFNTGAYDARIQLKNVSAYNWRTATGQLGGGPGQVIIEDLLGDGNRQVPGIIMRNAAHNIFGSDGSFETNSITMNAYLLGGDQTVTSKTALQWGTNGANGSASLSTSNAYARTGTYSLKVSRRGVGAGSGVKLILNAPVRQNAKVGVEFYYRMPVNVGTGTSTMYVLLYAAQIIGWTSYGSPIIGSKLFLGEPDQTIQNAGSSTWTQVTMNNMYSDASAAASGSTSAGIPPWANCIYIEINMINIPGEFDMYFDDLYGSYF